MNFGNFLAKILHLIFAFCIFREIFVFIFGISYIFSRNFRIFREIFVLFLRKIFAFFSPRNFRISFSRNFRIFSFTLFRKTVMQNFAIKPKIFPFFVSERNAKISETVGKKKFREKCEIFARRFFLLGGNPT